MAPDVFSKVYLENSRKRFRVTIMEDLSAREDAANYITKLGNILNLKRNTIQTAIISVQRFYILCSFKEVKLHMLAMAAIYVAIKVEYEYKSIKDVVSAHAVLLKGKPLDVRSEAYKKQKEQLITMESVLLTAIGFHFNFIHPFQFIEKLQKSFEQNDEVFKRAIEIATTRFYLLFKFGYHAIKNRFAVYIGTVPTLNILFLDPNKIRLHKTTLCLLLKPKVIAMVCINLASQCLSSKICVNGDDGESWLTYVKNKFSYQKIKEISDEFQHIAGVHSLKKKVMPPAIAEKEKGNEFYKRKKFEEALTHYDKAITLDPSEMLFLTNKAAVYFEQKEYEKCVKECEKAIEVGKEHRADFKKFAKVYSRMASAYVKMKDYHNAKIYYQKSLTEHSTRETLTKLTAVHTNTYIPDASPLFSSHSMQGGVLTAPPPPNQYVPIIPQHMSCTEVHINTYIPDASPLFSSHSMQGGVLTAPPPPHHYVPIIPQHMSCTETVPQVTPYKKRRSEQQGLPAYKPKGPSTSQQALAMQVQQPFVPLSYSFSHSAVTGHVPAEPKS